MNLLPGLIVSVTIDQMVEFEGKGKDKNKCKEIEHVKETCADTVVDIIIIIRPRL